MPSPNANGEKRLIYWLLGALLSLLLAGLGVHTKMTSDALQKLDDRLYNLTMEVRSREVPTTQR